jgi:hypothetical protein
MGRSLEDDIADALGTAERGSDLVEVARCSHEAEIELASLARQGPIGVLLLKGETFEEARNRLAAEVVLAARSYYPTMTEAAVAIGISREGAYKIFKRAGYGPRGERPIR